MLETPTVSVSVSMTVTVTLPVILTVIPILTLTLIQALTLIVTLIVWYGACPQGCMGGSQGALAPGPLTLRAQLSMPKSKSWLPSTP